MRLIDADKMIEELKKLAKGEVPSCPNIAEYFVSIRVDRIIDRLNNQPTAYDVDKVISKIWDRSELIHIKHTHNDEVEDYIRVTDASEIVKAGGIDE